MATRRFADPVIVRWGLWAAVWFSLFSPPVFAVFTPVVVLWFAARARWSGWERGLLTAVWIGWIGCLGLARAPHMVLQAQLDRWQQRWQSVPLTHARPEGHVSGGVWRRQGRRVELRGMMHGWPPMFWIRYARRSGWWVQHRTAGLFLYEVQRRDARWSIREIPVGARIVRDQTVWDRPPRPIWQRWLGIPVLLEVAPDVMQALDRVWTRTVRVDDPARLLRPRPDAAVQLHRWQARVTTLLHMVAWFGIFTGWMFTLGGRMFARSHIHAAALDRRVIALHLPATGLFLAGAWYMRGDLAWFAPTEFHVPGLPGFGRHLWAFSVGGAWVFAWGWVLGTRTLRSFETAMGALRRLPAIGRRVPSAAVRNGMRLAGSVLAGVAVLQGVIRMLFKAFEVSYIEFIDVFASPGIHLWMRTVMLAYLVGALVVVWAMVYRSMRRVRETPWAGVVVLAVVPGLILVHWTVAAVLMVWVSLWAILATRFARRTLFTWVCFIAAVLGSVDIVQIVWMERSRTIREEFVETAWMPLFRFQRGQADADLRSAMMTFDRLLQTLGAPPPVPSAAYFVWRRLPFADRWGASTVILLWHRTGESGVTQERFDWQMPWWALPAEWTRPPPDDRWHVVRRRVYDGGIRRLRIARRRWMTPNGSGQIVLAVAEDLYWGPWDAQPIPQPPSARLASTRAFEQLLGTFRFGAWTRQGTPITEGAWFFPPVPDTPPVRSGWRTIGSAAGERLAVYTVREPTLTIRVAVHVHDMREFLSRWASLFIWDFGILCSPFWVLVTLRRLRIRRRARSFRRLILRTTLVGMGLLWGVAYTAMALSLLRSLQHRLLEQTRQSAVQARTILQDYQNWTGAAEVQDPLMLWVRRTVRRDLDLYAGPRLVATSRRAAVEFGWVPILDAEVLQRAGYWTIPVPAEDRRVQWIRMPIAVDAYALRYQMWTLGHTLLTGLLITLALSVGVSRFLARRLVQPVRTIAAWIRAFEPRRRDVSGRRMPPRIPDEFVPIVQRFQQLMADLARYQKDAERLQQLAAWQEMARHVAHAVKNPLTPMQLTLDQMRTLGREQRWRELHEKWATYVDRLQRQIEILKRRVQAFSQYSQTIELQRQPVDLRQCIETVVAQYRVEHGPQIEVHADALEAWTVAADVQWITRALQNLIENAIEAGGPDVRIRITLRNVDRWVEIAIWNSGPPIPEDILPRIFDPAFTTKQYGSGLGLPLARRYVELHGGTLDVDNRPDGPVFRIRLPRNVSEHSV